MGESLASLDLSHNGAQSPGSAYNSKGGVLTVLQDMVTSEGLPTLLSLSFQPVSKSGQESGTRPQKSLFQLKFLGLELGQPL